MSLVLVNLRTASLPPSQLAAGSGDVTWVVYQDGIFLKSFGSAIGARTFIDGINIRKIQERYLLPPV